MRIVFLFLLASVLCGCTPTEVEKVDPNVPERPAPETPQPEEPVPPDDPAAGQTPPVLEVHFDKTACEPNETLAGTLVISHEGTAGSHAVATTLLTGTARITLDGVIVPTAGEWITAEADTLHVSIVPDHEGEVRIGFRARTLTNGLCSDPCEVMLTAEYPPELTVTAQCDPRLVNPTPATVVPVRLTLDYPKHTGEYAVMTSATRGAGVFIRGGQAIDANGFVTTDREMTIDYRPTILGEHILTFEIRAGEATATAVAYIEVVKNFTVTCPITEEIEIVGTGEYAVEGGTARFEMVNRQGYNFEAAGWHDGAGDLLSEGNVCEVVVNYTTPTELRLELKKRIVELTLTTSYRKPYTYPVSNGSGQIAGWKTVYDHRRNFDSDYYLSDDIYLYYEKYRWTTTVPPVEQKAWTIEPATGYFWRIDDDFRIRLRRSDNPQLRFDLSGHAAESASTRYIFPTEIIMQ